MRMKNKGFTLVELMIVVAIIGILAAVAIPRFADMLNRARESNAQADLGAIRSSLTIYYGRNAGAAEELDQLVDDYIGSLPGVSFRYYVDGDMDETIEWDDGTHNSEASWGGEDHDGDGDSNAGWHYDEVNLHVWIESDELDSQGDQIFTW